MKTSRFIVAAIAASLLIAQPAHADQLTGSGSSFIANFINECRVQYGKASGHNIEYTPLGSGAGINMFMQGTVDFAASDVAASQINKTKEFNGAIAQHGLDKQGVRVLKANFNNETAVIVIPFKLDFHKIEKDLYALPASKEGFWGQIGMGYAGKSWSEVK